MGDHCEHGYEFANGCQPCQFIKSGTAAQRARVGLVPDVLTAERKRIVGEMQVRHGIAAMASFATPQDRPAPELTVANVQLARIERLEREADAIRKAAADALAVVTRERDNALLRGDLAFWAERNALEGQNRIGDKAGALQDRLVREMGRKAFNAWARSTKGLIAPLAKDGES